MANDGEECTLANIRIPITAYILTVYPISIRSNKLAMPSFWTQAMINEAFADANRIWAQAKIEFGPIDIVNRDIYVREAESDMWADYVNELSPKRGIGAGFVFDFPGHEGGWGGGRIAIVGKKMAAGARDGFLGGILAHELGHVLIDHTHRSERHNLMFASRSPMVVTRDVLDEDQIKRAVLTAGRLVA